MKAVRFAILATLAGSLATPADACHRFSRWLYPWPQRCGAAGAAPAQRPPARIVAGEIEPPKQLQPPAEPIPSLPAPSNEDLDGQARAQAIERLKVELSTRASGIAEGEKR